MSTSSSTGSVSADELVRALDRRNATLPAEIATFVVLSGCESMLENGPRELSGLASVRISEHGSVALSGLACDDETSARSLHRVLSTLLLAAGPSLPPALRRLAEDGPIGSHFTLRALLDELEAALVPLNRTASRRVLSRFAREAAHPVVASEDVDAALNSLLGVSDPPANDAPLRGRHSPAADGLNVDMFDGLDLGGEESHYLEPSSSRRELDDLVRAASSSVRPSVRPSFAPPAAFVPSAVSTPQRDRDSLRSLRALAGEPMEEGSAATSRKLFIGFSLIALAIVSVVVALSMREPDVAPEQSAAGLDTTGARPEGGDLVLHVVQPNAQVLRFVGRAPVSVPGLPVGVAHEFVATSEGHRPSRVLVSADAEWEPTAEGARYELALQLEALEPTAKPNASLDLGPSRLGTQAGRAGARLGSIRVVTTPRGALVYQLVGFSPDVTVQDLPLDQPQELLIYREGYRPIVRALSAGDFAPKNGRRTAELSVDLQKLQ